MCGGRGTRFEAEVEKPLYEIRDRAMVDRVVEALEASRVERTHAVVSPNAPATREHLRGHPTIETPGEGYVADLQRALDTVERPVLTVAADLPLLEADAIDWVLDAHVTGAMTICVPAALKRVLSVSVDETMDHDGRTLAPTGVNVVDGGSSATTVTHDVRFAVNVNRLADARVAEALL